jgi:S-methylmethionine-dependent homocysteine/selenocysteine methylase
MSQAGASFADRFASGRTVLLDGALGTRLEDRGVPCGLPLWSTHALLEAPDAVLRVHREYARAGAEVLTAGTFRTQARTLARAGVADLEDRAAELCRSAVEIARTAAEADDHPIWVAGSAPPLEDCYRPDLVPDDASCRREHEAHAENLAAAGVDVVAVETMNSVREAAAAARAVAQTGLPFWVSFVCTSDSRMLSGESLSDGIDAVRDAGPLAVGVNCLPPAAVAGCLPALRASDLPFCVYANLGAPSADGRRTDACTPKHFAEHAVTWTRAGAVMVGGCCGTGPAHVRSMAKTLSR